MLETALVVAALLTGLVAGLLFGFAVVAMPGIKSLGDREFVRAFQVMDRVIQDNQPVFMLAWLGSVVAVVVSTVLGLTRLEGADLALLLVAAAAYLIGVQAPTATVNIPLNNRIQEVRTEQASDREVATARRAFESRWNRWNAVRTMLATTSTALLIVLLLRL